MVTGHSPYHWLIGQPPTWLLVTPHITGLQGNPPHGYWLLPISLTYRETPHMVTGYSPYHWLIGKPPTWLLVTPHIN